MGKVALVVDSVACLPSEMLREYHIHVVPVKLVLNGKVYRDGVDLTVTEAYDLLKHARQATTSAPSPGDFLQAYGEAGEEAEDILCLTLSSRLSVLYNSALQAKQLFLQEHPQARIEILDTQMVTAAEGFIALAAAREAAQGGGLAEALQRALEVKEKVAALFLFDTLRYVHRTGRIPRAASLVGSLLPVKPLLIVKEGELHPLGVARNRTQGLDRMLRVVRERVGERGVHMAIMHAQVPEEAEQLKRRVASEFHCVELFVTDFTPVMGYATGPGVLGLAFYPEG